MRYYYRYDHEEDYHIIYDRNLDIAIAKCHEHWVAALIVDALNKDPSP